VLSQFLALTETLEYEDDGWLSITSAEWERSTLTLTTSVRLPDAAHHNFRIVCTDPRSHHIVAAGVDDLVTLTADHVVLWPNTEQQGELYFNGAPNDPASLLGSLIETHLETVGRWYAVDYFLNLSGHATDVLRGGHGLLAKGPVPLLKAYAEVLDRHGASHSSPPYRDPVWWSDSQWIPEREQLFALIVGESYVVAPTFLETAV